MSNFSLLVYIKQFLLDFINYLRVVDNLLVDVQDGFVKSVELLFVDVRSDVGFFGFLLFDCFHLASFFSFKSLLLLRFSEGCLVFSFVLLLLLEFSDDFIESFLLSSVLYFEPVDHNSIFKLKGKFSDILLFFVVMNLDRFVVLLGVVLSLMIWVSNDVI